MITVTNTIVYSQPASAAEVSQRNTALDPLLGSGQGPNYPSSVYFVGTFPSWQLDAAGNTCQQTMYGILLLPTNRTASISGGVDIEEDKIEQAMLEGAGWGLGASLALVYLVGAFRQIKDNIGRRRL